MRFEMLLVACAILICFGSPAEAQTCVSDCGCPPGWTCQPADVGGACKESVCPSDYTPVCGLDGKTYGNACQASLNRVGVAQEGECESDAGDGDDEIGRYCGTCCHPTLVSDQGAVIWTGDPNLDMASRAGTGRYRVAWTVDVADDAFFVQPVAPNDDFPRSLVGWPARIGPTEVEVTTDAHYVNGSASHTHREPLDVQFSLLRCPPIDAE